MKTSYVRSALALAALAGPAGCFHKPPLPPTTGYGAPYKGTGEGIYVKDSRDDWDITEGHHKITSEQALEAAGDQEYEARRQIAKAYNDRLYQEALHHQHRAYQLMEASGAAIVVGFLLYSVLAPHLQSESTTPAAAGMPEVRTYKSGFAATGMASLGGLLMIGGIGGIPYAYWGGRRKPPYHIWRTPGPLNRPAYVRQQTEPYNEKIGAPSLPPGFDQGKALPASMQLHAPASRHVPRPRGAR